MRIFHPEIDASFMGGSRHWTDLPGNDFLPVVQGDPGTHLCGGFGFDLDGHRDFDPLRVRMILPRGNIPQTPRVDRPQINRLPNAGGREAGSPIPSKTEGGLADLAESGHLMLGRRIDHRADLLAIFNIGRRGVKPDLDLIHSGHKKRFHVELPMPEHIVRSPQEFSIKGQVSDRIPPFTAKKNTGLLEEIRRKVEFPLIGPTVLKNPAQGLFVITHKRIWNFARCEKVRMHATRHLRGNGLVGVILPKSPAAIKFNYHG